MADLSQNLFQRYNRIMGRALLGVLLATAALIYLQVERNLYAIKEMLVERMQEHATALDAILERTSDGVSTLQFAAQQYLRTHLDTEAPSPLLQQLLASPRNGMLHLDVPPAPWGTGDLGNLTGYDNPLDPSRRRELEMALSLNPMLAAIKADNSSAAWFYYTSARNFINIYPWIDSRKFSFAPSLYREDFFLHGLPAANPKRSLFWTTAYLDQVGLGLMVTAAAPVYEGDTFRGTVAIDMTLEDLNRFLGRWKSPFGTLFVASINGQLLGHTTLVKRDAGSVLGVEAALPKVLRPDSTALLTQAEGILTLSHGYYVMSQTLRHTPFRLVLLVPRREIVMSALQNGLLAAALLGVGLTLMLAVATWLTRREFIGPAAQLVHYIGEESRGAAVAIPRVPPAWQPWFETIRRVFNAHSQLVSIQQELDVARRMQQSIVPTRFPSRPDVQIFARMLPAKEVGGDFYDYFWLDERRIGVVIADVSGKGVPAALFMAVSRTLLRATAPAAATPAECLVQANNLLSQDNDATMFVTVFYGILDTETGRIEYANGGHNPPFIVTSDGDVLSVPNCNGIALGVMEGATYSEGSVMLASGSALLLYTDGVTEAFDVDGQEFTERRLIETLANCSNTTPNELVGSIITTVHDFAGEAPQADDLTCLAIRYVAYAPELGDESA
ncbi:SpoIIE family protein phosphatase [Hyphomicrobium sp. MC1]|uniref:SpoIIE family protein phosphatase n=1 Tax=Hyphomicrobium sp. (strain MC1) TaxID=717785 RepID=UPI000213EFE6|nr:SpoIIE family protein phosphatase [Hyphomicrobium sp. MC1]CCB66691.1 putative Serine phosphatase RsbU regulator sigma subunit [Hyphomicrobium sp. MC1]